MRFPQPRSTRITKGFSILELMIVLLILGILAVTVIPRVATSVRKHRIDLAARHLVADLEYFGETARAQSGLVLVEFIAVKEPKGNRYFSTDITDSQNSRATFEVEFPRLVYLDAAPEKVVFDQYGNPDADYEFELSDGKTTTKIVSLSLATGQAEIKQ